MLPTPPTYDGSTPGADKFVPKVQQATRSVVGNKAYWRDVLGTALHIGAFHVVEMSDAEKEALSRYHEPLAFAAEGRPPQRLPNLRLTVKGAAKGRVPSLHSGAELPVVCKQSSATPSAQAPKSWKARRERPPGAARVQDLRMCQTCYKVAARMHSCNGCHHAWYCGRECQRAGWESGHKRQCQAFTATLTSRGIQPAPGVFQLPACIGFLMQPDCPPLCRFWLAGLVSALGTAAPVDLHLALNPILAFLWRFTFAAVPKPLRGDLATAVYSARVQLAAELERLRQGAMRGQVPPAAEFVAPALMVVCALIAVIERDDVFRIWRRTAEGGAVKLPSSTLDPAMEAYVRSVKGTIIAGGILSQDALIWDNHEHADLDARTARLAIGSVPRGIGLVASAFGVLVATKTHATVVERLNKITAKLPKSVKDLDAELVHTYQVGWLDPMRRFDATTARPAARSDPKHLIVTEPRRLRCNGVQLGRDEEVAETFMELKAAGARALPVLPGQLPGESERRFMSAWNDMIVDAEACKSCYERRGELLRGMGGACASMADRAVLMVAPMHAPDVML